jgi:hypothetical protein
MRKKTQPKSRTNVAAKYRTKYSAMTKCLSNTFVGKIRKEDGPKQAGERGSSEVVG